MKRVLYALVLILIVLASVAGYEFYVIIQQQSLIEIQSTTIQEKEVMIQLLTVEIDEMNNSIITLKDQNAKLVLTIEEKDRLIAEFRAEILDLNKALQNSSQWPDKKTLARFLYEDRTDNNQYIKGSYECEEFALDLQKAAYKKGYFLSVQYVTVGLLRQYGWEYQAPRAMTHVCNLAFVIDENAFYIVEPQTDQIAFLSYAD